MTTWQRAITAVSCVLVSACGQDTTQPAADDFAGQFETVWDAFDRNYSYFEYKKINWDSLGDAHRVRAASSRTQAEFIGAVIEMLKPLRDVHIWFQDPGGQTIATYRPAASINWQRASWEAEMTRQRFVQKVSNWGYAWYDDIAYLAIGAWNPAQVRIEEVDAALELLQSSRALILDVRTNGGGNDALAHQVAGRFTTATVIAEYIQFRDGPRHSDLGSLITKSLAPRGPWQYTKPVVVLAGRGSFSSNESFISAMRELPNVIIMGDTTGGSSGNPQRFTLPGGWSYMVPRWIAYTADRRVIEWNGIPPDTVINTPPSAFDGASDPVITAAVRWLRARLGS